MAVMSRAILALFQMSKAALVRVRFEQAFSLRGPLYGFLGSLAFLLG
jgi:hypothetical protein